VETDIYSEAVAEPVGYLIANEPMNMDLQLEAMYKEAAC
jgi:hypothetical protein